MVDHASGEATRAALARSDRSFGSILLISGGQCEAACHCWIHFDLYGHGFGQNSQSRNSSPDKITLLAENETKDGGILKLRGHVEVITGSMTVYADEADYNALTGDLDAHGHVHINFGKVTPAMKIQNASPEDLPATIPFKK